ncbi:MAG: hypothetical protein HZA58_03010 [Acidimicrobiia bacterium]|nr:hypothetical protein [Acidimicrobiia bacterium]
MHYTNNEIVKALADERLRQTSVHRMTGADAAERDGPIGRLRHRAGHAMIVAGELVAHGTSTAAHGVHQSRAAD